jgi:hypothetical protein
VAAAAGGAVVGAGLAWALVAAGAVVGAAWGAQAARTIPAVAMVLSRRKSRRLKLFLFIGFFLLQLLLGEYLLGVNFTIFEITELTIASTRMDKDVLSLGLCLY